MLAEAARAAASTVVAALQKASQATGVDFNYLLGTAIRESGLKPHAKSSNSSASGLFQFVEQTWLSLVKEFGAKYGLSSYANAIHRDDNGHYHAADPNDRSAILRLRNDPQISALMAGEYTRQTQDTMQDRLGRKVTSGELYAAHLFGPGSACKLIRENQNDPTAAACDFFPRAADANKNIFYNTDGTPKTVREVYDWTVRQPLTPTINFGSNTAISSVPSLSKGLLDTSATADALASLWGPPKKGFFSSSDGGSGNTAPFAMSPQILDILQTVAKDHGRK
jgi:Transglycosylase SLT domain